MTDKLRKPVHKIEIGERFGKWTVIGPAKRRYHFRCVCDCGHRSAVPQYNLLAGKTTQCIFCHRAMPRKKELLGKRFGKWTVLEYVGHSHWRCRCDCGTEKTLRTQLIGKAKSCQKCCKRIKVDEDRLTIITAALKADVSAASIARILGLSPQRIYQIVVAQAERERNNK